MEIDIEFTKPHGTQVAINFDNDEADAYELKEWGMDHICSWISGSIRAAITTEVIKITDDYTYLHPLYTQLSMAQQELGRFNMIVEAAKKLQDEEEKELEDRGKDHMSYIG